MWFCGEFQHADNIISTDKQTSLDQHSNWDSAVHISICRLHQVFSQLMHLCKSSFSLWYDCPFISTTLPQPPCGTIQLLSFCQRQINMHINLAVLSLTVFILASSPEDECGEKSDMVVQNWQSTTSQISHCCGYLCFCPVLLIWNVFW